MASCNLFFIPLEYVNAYLPQYSSIAREENSSSAIAERLLALKTCSTNSAPVNHHGKGVPSNITEILRANFP